MKFFKQKTSTNGIGLPTSGTVTSVSWTSGEEADNRSDGSLLKGCKDVIHNVNPLLPEDTEQK
jgi:hypothetical protein